MVRETDIQTDIQEKYNSIVENNIYLLNEKQITKDNLAKYRDPDKYTKYEINIDSITVLIAQDGLCSIQKIFEFSENIVKDYTFIRKNKFDFLIWPAYAMSINQIRATVFQDRIDFLLNDLEKFYKVIESSKTLSPSIVSELWSKCKIARAYLFPNTFYWLCSFGDFDSFLCKRKLKQFLYESDGSKIVWPNDFKDYYNKLIEILIDSYSHNN